MLRRSSLLALVLALGCRANDPTPDDDEVGSEADDDADADESSTGTGEDSDDTDDADSSDGSDDGIDPSAACEDLGLSIEPMLEGSGNEIGDVAGDFTVETTFGPWNLTDNFSGCDSYVFVQHTGDAVSDALRSSFTVALFERSAPNVHYFFLSSGDAVLGADAWQTAIGQALAPLDEASTAAWIDRVHFVTTEASEVEGSVGEFFAAHPDARVAGIDRFQSWDNPGSTSDFGGGGFVQSGSVLGYTSRWYDHRHAQETELAAQSVTEVAVIDSVEFAPDCLVGEDCFDVDNGPFSNSNNNSIWAAQFPDAATMAGFDRMQFVVTSTCGPDSYADCGHWDYEAFIHLCADETCAAERWEMLRWITPYSRPGTTKWVFEATPLLGLVGGGGEQNFQFGMRWNMNPAIWDVGVRLWNSGTGDPASRTVLPAFVGNEAFNDAYNDWPTFEFTPPMSTSRVEVVALISGHGQEESNCAEWCNHQHEFIVNGGSPHIRDFPGQVVDQACGAQSSAGVVPGQYGNWTPGRAGWCPGMPVQPWVLDVSDEVQLGQLNSLDYRGLFGGQPPSGAKGRILLSTYVVYYE